MCHNQQHAVPRYIQHCNILYVTGKLHYPWDYLNTTILSKLYTCPAITLLKPSFSSLNLSISCKYINYKIEPNNNSPSPSLNKQ